MNKILGDLTIVSFMNFRSSLEESESAGPETGVWKIWTKNQWNMQDGKCGSGK